MVILAILIVHWYLSLFCQTFFLHRYAAHGMYKMSPFWERFFYLFTFLMQGPSFLNPRAYSILHQRHHHHSDTERDPHSPYNHRNFLEMMVKTLSEYKACFSLTDPNDVKKNWPIWPRLDHFAVSFANILLWTIIYVFIYVKFATTWWLFFFLPLHFIMGPIQGAIVNWCGHKIGYRNFQLQDQSRNTLFLDIFLMGELFQNNHHRFSQRSNFAHKWFEWDLGHTFIKILVLCRVVKKV